MKYASSDKWPKSCECVCSVRASARSQTRSMASGSSENPFTPSVPHFPLSLSPDRCRRSTAVGRRAPAVPSPVASPYQPSPARRTPPGKTFSFQSLIFPAFLYGTTTADSIHHATTATATAYVSRAYHCISTRPYYIRRICR